MFTIKNKDVISSDLLSVEETENIPTWILANGEWWWLRSPGYNSYHAVIIHSNGYIYNIGRDIDYYTVEVRPALKVLNLSELEIGETVKVFNRMAQYIGNGKVLLCESIFKSRFDEESNNYETSEVKYKLDEWFEQIKSEV